VGRLQHAPCGYVAFSDTYVIQDINLEAERMLSLEHGKLIGKPLAEILPPRTRVYFSAQVYPALARNGAVYEAYVSLRRASGDELATLMNVVRRELVGVTVMECVFMAMQRRRLFEQELIGRRREALAAARAEQLALEQLKAAQSQLAAQDQLASLGMLAAGVAHEINNPLAYLAANLELIEQRLEEPLDKAELRGMVSEAADGVMRIRNIVSSLRTLSRVEQQNPRAPIDLREVVQVTARLAGNQLRRDARFEVNVPNEPVVALGDAGRLGQVVLNLLVNAGQALPKGRKQNLITLSALREGDDAVLQVEDNGDGIPPEVLPRIFSPFFTTKPVGVGTGLGLSVCKGIVASLGGTMTVNSRYGEGATFRVVLPLSEATLEPPPAEPVVETRATAHGGATPTRVLVIDDDEHVTRVIARALRDFEVKLVNRSQDALAILAVEGFDVILCDLIMPHSSGIDIYRELARTRPELAQRMIFLTGGTVSADDEMFLTTVGNPCVRKPFATDALCAACLELAHKHSHTGG
jgi:signal transduction histidine kinase